MRPFPFVMRGASAPRSADGSAAFSASRGRSFAAVVAAQVAAAAAQDEKERQDVADTSHPVSVAAGEQEQQENDVVAPASAVAEKAVHDMYLLLDWDRSQLTIRIPPAL